MPQMAPINWILLLLYFIIVFFITNSLNYFITIPKINFKKKDTFNKTLLNWKW